MGVFSIISTVVVGTGVFLAAFKAYNNYEYSQFKIDRQDGKIMLVTGANSGLGYETSRVLAKNGATVVMACRNQGRCDEAKMNILKETPNAKVDTLLLDLGSFTSIRKAASTFKSKYDHLDVLINNAGIMMIPTRELTKDGLESQIGTNHFGHFLLTGLLFPVIGQNGRIINHSSGAHMFHKANFVTEDLLCEKYDGFTAYGNSKAANLLFTYELNNRLTHRENPKNIVSIAVHPGYTSTNLQAGKFPFWEQLNAIFAMKVEDGALGQIKAAVDKSVKPSFHNIYGPKFGMCGAPAETSTSKSTWDHEAQQKLWEESIRITGESFGGL